MTAARPLLYGVGTFGRDMMYTLVGFYLVFYLTEVVVERHFGCGGGRGVTTSWVRTFLCGVMSGGALRLASRA